MFTFAFQIDSLAGAGERMERREEAEQYVGTDPCMTVGSAGKPERNGPHRRLV